MANFLFSDNVDFTGILRSGAVFRLASLGHWFSVL
jgi:hypothetical protein